MSETAGGREGGTAGEKKEKEERRLLKLYLFHLGVMHVCEREGKRKRVREGHREKTLLLPHPSHHHSSFARLESPIKKTWTTKPIL